MRVRFSRRMAVAIAAISISAVTSTGCSTMGRAPGATWMSSWWHKSPSESYASRTPTPSEKSTPVVTTSLGNASGPPKDPTITPYGSNGSIAQAQPSGGYPAAASGTIQPNYAASAPAGNANTTGASSGNPYAPTPNPYATAQPAATSTQVVPAGANGYGPSATGGSSVYANAAPQANPYSNPYAEAPSYQTADARNSTWGNQSAPAAGPSGGAAPASSIQPYNGGSYPAGNAQPYGNFTPPPSYTPPADSYAPPSGYGASTAPAPSAPASQPPASGYAPGSTTRYYATERSQPAPVDNANDMFDDSGVAPAGYDQGGSAPGSYNAGGNYGGGSYPSTGSAGGSYPYQ